MGCSVAKSQAAGILTPPLREDRQSMEGLKITAGLFVQENEHEFAQIYEMGSTLGTGGFGDVKKCTHKESGAERAVKIFRKDLIPQDQLESGSFFQEIEILRSLDHPNIVKVFEFFEDTKRVFIVMELCRGGELFAQLVQRSRFDERQAACVMKQVLSAVTYLHSRGIIHRDLKPENILLEEAGDDLNIKLVDFGTATFYNRKKRLTGKMGTAYYVAPEVLVGSYDEKCDVWSSGVIIYIMLCGRPPFEGSNTGEILDKVVQRSFTTAGPPWDLISKEALDIINRMLAPVDTRITALAALSHPWIRNFAESKSPQPDLVIAVMSNMRAFTSRTKLKDAVLTFLATQSLTLQDTKELRDVFRSIDKNGDGKLSQEELFNKYKETMGAAEAREQVERIMEEVDTDRNGFIDYTEFLKASLDQRKLLSKRNLSEAFSLFDQDGSGTISAQEVRKVLERGNMMQEEVWTQIIQEVDVNGDGEIDLKEFELLLMSKL